MNKKISYCECETIWALSNPLNNTWHLKNICSPYPDLKEPFSVKSIESPFLVEEDPFCSFDDSHLLRKVGTSNEYIKGIPCSAEEYYKRVDTMLEEIDEKFNEEINWDEW